MKVLKEHKRHCTKCDKRFTSTRLFYDHLEEAHNQTFQEYIMETKFNDIIPECKCGCGTKMKFNHHNQYFKDYTTNHFPREPHTEEVKRKIARNTKKAIRRKYGVDNVMELEKFRQKIKDTKEERYGDPNYNNFEKYRETSLEKYGYDNILKSPEWRREKIINKNTKIELEFESWLKENGYNYEKQWNSGFGIVDFYVEGIPIEIDGVYWHPLKLEDISIQLINSAINDYKKNSNIPGLIRLRLKEFNLEEVKNLDELLLYNSISDYPKQYSIKFWDKILTKEYIKRYLEEKGKDKLEKYIPLLLDFIRLFQPTLPDYPAKKDFNFIMKNIPSKIEGLYTPETKSFRNNCSNLGVAYLKSNFKSYWKSSFKGNPSSTEIWEDDKKMYNIIKYRIGLNNSGEIFDFSLHQLVRGISAIRGTVSFFKPVIAAAIYHHYLGEKEAPIILDPCAGFGGRMMGFKAIYPNGKYIGIEPNVETFNELKKLSKKFKGVKLYNCKFEDFELKDNYDLIFTSIPYYDKETYSNPVEYPSYENWVDVFLGKFKEASKNNKVVINLQDDIASEFNYKDCKYFINSASHYNSASSKKELFIEL